MHYIRLLHIYAGLVLSLLLLVLSLTGTALIYKNEFWQLSYDELGGGDVVPSAEEQADAIAMAHARYGDRLRSVKMPEPGVAAYHLYLHDGEAFLSLDRQQWIDEWQLRERLMGFLFDLHAHLLAGESGEVVGGVIGLAAAVMALTGVVLWFPTRRMFSPRKLWPRSLTRADLLAWHRDMGMVLSPLLLLLLLTGSGMVFYSQVQVFLNGLFGDEVPRTELPQAAPLESTPLPDAATLRRVRDHLPDTRLMYYFAGDNETGLNRFRLKRDCELHPNGRTFIYTDGASGEVLLAEDPCAMPPGERILHTIYPLHAAKVGAGVGGGLYKLLAFLGGLALAGLSVTGVVTYVQKLRRQKRARQRNQRLASRPAS